MQPSSSKWCPHASGCGLLPFQVILGDLQLDAWSLKTCLHWTVNLSAVLSSATSSLGQTEAQQATVRSPLARPRCRRRSPVPQCALDFSAPGLGSRVVCKRKQTTFTFSTFSRVCAYFFVKMDPVRTQVPPDSGSTTRPPTGRFASDNRKTRRKDVSPMTHRRYTHGGRSQLRVQTLTPADWTESRRSLLQEKQL